MVPDGAWKVGVVPDGADPAEVEAALAAAAGPFMSDGYREVARIPGGLQLSRERKATGCAWAMVLVVASLMLVVGWLFPIRKATDPIYIWADGSGGIWAVRDLVLLPVDLRP